MSGGRGAPVGSKPGRLNISANEFPEKTSPMPAMFAVAGDCVSSMLTEFAVVQLLFSQISETSSSVGPMPVGLDGDSELGRQPDASRIVAGDVVTGPLVVIPVYREESTGLCPCLAVITISVELSSPLALRADAICAMEA